MPIVGGIVPPPAPPALAGNVSPTHEPPTAAWIVTARGPDNSPPISPSIPSGTGKGNDSFRNQRENIEPIPLSSVRVIKVASVSK